MTSTSPVPLLLTRADVAELLEVELWSLTWWIWALDERRRYTEFDIRRRNGEPRRISAPIPPIKAMQRRLAGLLLEWYPPPGHVHGFVRERSPRSNAAPHRGQQWVLKVDIADFFPAINFGRVRGLFRAFPFDFPDDVATVLAQLCCHRNELPQGAPTSPVISNLICRGLDRDLAALARTERCYFTRYADDLTFSTDRTVFPKDLAYLDGTKSVAGVALVERIQGQGFRVNHGKTRLTRRWQRQRVTGLVVNEKVNVPREYIRSVRNLLHIWRVHGITAAEEALRRVEPIRNWPPGKEPPDFASVVRGRVQYIGSIKGWNDSTYRALALDLAAVDEDFGWSDTAAPTAAARVATEGETDVTHLKAALAHFQEAGEFTRLSLVFDERSAAGSDTKLARLLRDLPATKPASVVVCVFDRDKDTTLQDVGLHSDEYTDRGNGVVGIALAVPDFRQGPVCVELLYRDDDLRRVDAGGRRVYLTSEFDRRTGHHHSEPCSTPKSKSEALVCDEVWEFETGRSIALSKTAFADAVAKREEPFSEVSFDGFRPTFELIERAIAAVADKVGR